MAERTPSRPGRPSASRPGVGARSGSATRSTAARPAPRESARDAAREGREKSVAREKSVSRERSEGRPVGRAAGAASRTGGARPSGTRPASRTGPAKAGRSGGAGPGKARPALAARPRTVVPTPPSPSTAWVRGAILIGIVVMLAVTLVPTLRSLIQQRGDTAALQETISQQQQTVAGLERQAALWKDPAYIEMQARERLKFVRVGDRAYTVVDPTRDAAAPAAGTQPVVSAPMANASSPWYGKLWQSVQIADQPTAGLPQRK